MILFVWSCTLAGAQIYRSTQVESANLNRSYRRAPKSAGDDDFNGIGAGVCHLCLCGQGVDWENL